MPRRRLRGEEAFRRELGKRVRKLREERKWSQPELARHLGDRTKMRVYRLERAGQQDKGDGVPTTLGLIEELAAAFGIEMGDLLWPIVEPVDATSAQQQAVRRNVQAIEKTYARLRRDYLAALTSDEAQRLLRIVGRLGMAAPKDLGAVDVLAEWLMKRGETEHPVAWPGLMSEEEEDDGEEG